MALQNALGELALDDSLQALIAAVNGLATQLADLEHDTLAFPPRALQYSRSTVDDSMRVTLQNASVAVTGAAGTFGTSSQMYWGAGGVYPLWYATGGPNAMDARETQREMSQQTFNDVRNARWTFS